MKPSTSYFPKPSPCHYLPEQMWRLEYRVIPALSKEEYLSLINQGWRRFGFVVFRPSCSNCTACQPIRILVSSFQADRSQRRVTKANADTRLVIGKPMLDEERLNLYIKHHTHHAETKGWPRPERDGGAEHISSIVEGPIPVQEWAYYVEDRLVAVSYIDELGDGFSGIYFYHDPDLRKRSLGTWICLSVIEEAAKRALPYVYLGYYIKGCRSMEYKGRFDPHEVLACGSWVPHVATHDAEPV